jgi:hypothetical protein
MNTKITRKQAALLGAVLGIVPLGMAPLRATELNFLAGGSGTINGAFFTTTDNASTGTGVIDSFVRMGTNGNSESGYNATARPVMPDVNTSPSFTRDIQLSAVPIVTNPTGAAPGSYYEFLLDINQLNASPNLTLYTLQVWTKSTALTTADTLAALTGSGATKRYDMDTGSDSRIQLNYSLNSGSGSGDMFFYVPTSAFAGVPTTSFVYLYSAFGTEDGGTGTYYPTNDGFEEWAVRTNTPSFSVADGSTTISLLGGALLALAALRRRFKLA